MPPSFQELLRTGQHYEDQIIEFMARRYDGLTVLSRPSGNYKYFDFMLSNSLKYECKYDQMSDKTGNIFIEYEQSNKPSGICTTTADVYVIGNKRKTLFILVDKLKQMISNREYFKRYVSTRKCGYLFNISTIERNSYGSEVLYLK